MRLSRAIRPFVLSGLVLLGSCATNPLSIPPPPHALPTRPRIQAVVVDGDTVAESRPAGVPTGYAAGGDGEPWRTGDSIAFTIDFEDGPKQQSYWLILEVTRGPRDEDELSRASVKTTLLSSDGTEIGTSVRRVAPSRIEDAGKEVVEAYASLIARAASGEAPETIQDTIEDELAEGSTFDDARRRAFRELKRTVAPRFVRETLKEPGISSSIGSISVFDLALAALSPIEVLLDVNRLTEEQTALVELADLPAPSKIRIPLVMSIGGAIQFRFAMTLSPPVPPFSLSGGILELAGVNEARADRNFIVRLVGSTRGSAPESKPVESRPAESQPADDPSDEDR